MISYEYRITEIRTVGITRYLVEAPLMELYSEFMNLRIDPYIRELERTNGKGRIFPFARGLRLSAKLIYLIRQRLEGTGLDANWGQLVDKDSDLCSCECDIIVHKHGCIHKWNGSQHPVMDYRFIKQEDAVLVVSCKSYITSNNIDSQYPKQIEPFIKRVWLFAECCGPRSIKSIYKRAQASGYEYFWPLYLWNRNSPSVPCQKAWIDFDAKLEQIRKEYLH